ncbi:hypothetical protein D9M68_593160 [compost metagenome]
MDLGHAQHRADRLGDVGPVSREHGQPPYARLAQQAQRARGVHANQVHELQCPDQHAVDRDQRDRGALVGRALQHGLAPRWPGIAAAGKGGRSHCHHVLADLPGNASTGSLGHARR